MSRASVSSVCFWCNTWSQRSTDLEHLFKSFLISNLNVSNFEQPEVMEPGGSVRPGRALQMVRRLVPPVDVEDLASPVVWWNWPHELVTSPVSVVNVASPVRVVDQASSFGVVDTDVAS